MLNVCFGTALRLTILFSFYLISNAPAWGQSYNNPYDAGVSGAYNPWSVDDRMSNLPRSPQPQALPGAPAIVSVDTLRHPLSSKGRQLLEKTMQLARRGNHGAAIKGLRDALVKFPADAAYVHNLLGFEFLETNQLMEAKNSYEEAVRLMPHESPNHANYALSLAITGDLDSAEKEVRKAIELDGNNVKAKSILELLLKHKRPKSAVLQSSK
jgi:tetratricopeptide (TPR) repeat protein